MNDKELKEYKKSLDILTNKKNLIKVTKVVNESRNLINNIIQNRINSVVKRSVYENQRI